jgi:Fur family zinc uptake transcriptional regulator
VERLSAWAKKAKFAVGQMTLEIRGRCRTCSARTARVQA